ncbi:hypothetical protein PFISCL1PPCAC_3760 [Pristionchus fissidentatus]|uniref:C-type lectin domain-containing protein n=1 Tax=Pristionchus fissidentatus TaxID=1538716 RepID=A0AAV5V228_9BILA|nr:hypothetical protein PFISCL1PPCAC_3760 [Pristionchus fissidentatus]
MTRLTLLLSLFTLYSDALVCQSGYNVTIGGRCYKIQYIEHGLEKADAEQRCANENAVLPSIHSDEDNAALVAARDLQCGNCFAFLGIKCTNEGKLGWMDGTRLDYTHYYPGSNLPKCDPQTFETTDDYILLDTGYWRDFGDGSSVGALICEQRNQEYDCGDFNEFNGKCYKVFNNEPMEWADAEGACKDMGGHLASIHDQQTSDFVRRSAVGAGVIDPVYIGLSRTDESKMAWSDGSVVDYSNWQLGEPESGPGAACTTLHPNTVAGLWYTESCDEQRKFVCERQLGSG